MAEGARFELARPLQVWQFSRLFPSTTQAPLRYGAKQNRLTDSTKKTNKKQASGEYA